MTGTAPLSIPVEGTLEGDSWPLVAQALRKHAARITGSQILFGLRMPDLSGFGDGFTALLAPLNTLDSLVNPAIEASYDPRNGGGIPVRT